MTNTLGFYDKMEAYNGLVKKFTTSYITELPWNQEYLDMQELTICAGINEYGLRDIWNEIQECLELLKVIGIKMDGKTYEVQWSKAIKNYGTCQYIGSNHYLIKINEEYLRVGQPEDIHNTIMHEVLHSIDGCMNHGNKWKDMAAKVNQHYAYTPISRLGDDKPYKEVIASNYHYQLICQCCGATWNYIRKSPKAIRVAKSKTSFHTRNGITCCGPFKFIEINN